MTGVRNEAAFTYIAQLARSGHRPEPSTFLFALASVTEKLLPDAKCTPYTYQSFRVCNNDDLGVFPVYDLTRFSAFVVEGRPLSQSVESAAEAIEMGASAGMASIGRMMSVQTEIANHTAASLIQFLHFKTTTTRQAYNRSDQWWGRWYNRMSGQHSIYVQMSGHHLVQILNSVGKDNKNSKIPQQAQCGIRLDIAEFYLSKLQEIYLAKN